jgi:predicted amidohydrolase
MSRLLSVAAAQLGPIEQNESRLSTVNRLIVLMEQAVRLGAELVVYPEAALTAFFPHWWIEDEKDLDVFFEPSMPNPDVQPLFDAAKRFRVPFCLGYTEMLIEEGRKKRFNSAILVSEVGKIIGKYRKVHLPGYAVRRPGDPFQNLEKKYFEVGNLGFPVWDAFNTKVGILICNDRRWPESYRVLALQGAELILIGYNTPLHNPAMPESDALANYHNHLVMQAAAYQNSAWVIGVAKAGVEEGVMQIGQSCVISPSGEIVAQASTLGDEVVIARCDLDLAARYRATVFKFSENRRPEYYRAITEPGRS